MSDYYNARIRIIKSGFTYYWYANKIGETFEVKARVDGKGGYLLIEGDNLYQIARDDAIEMRADRSEYEEKSASKTDLDLIIELSRTVADLAGRLEDAEEKIEMLTDDVVTLDERSQPLVDDGVSDFAKELAELVETEINERLRTKGRL